MRTGTKSNLALCWTDRLMRQVLGAVGALPENFTELEIPYFLLKWLPGIYIEEGKIVAKVQKLSKNEVLMMSIGFLSTGGISVVEADLAKSF